MSGALGIAFCNPEIVRELLEELPRRPSIDLVVADISGGSVITATGLRVAVIVEVCAERVAIHVVIPTVAVTIRPVSSPSGHGCLPDDVQVMAVVSLISDFT